MPYRSGIPINAIAPSMEDDDSPAQIWCTEEYQSFIGSIGWLAMSTRPDLSAVHSFLSSYSNKPAVGQMKAALLSSLGNRTVASSDRSCISSASFGIQFFYCQKHDIPVPL
jgi:hypothetical protein